VKVSFEATQNVARKALRDQLEYDVTGLINEANLSFDQAIAYSIALSLKQLVAHEDRKETESRRC
jgi:hypothetical protein